MNLRNCKKWCSQMSKRIWRCTGTVLFEWIHLKRNKTQCNWCLDLGWSQPRASYMRQWRVLNGHLKTNLHKELFKILTGLRIESDTLIEYLNTLPLSKGVPSLKLVSNSGKCDKPCLVPNTIEHDFFILRTSMLWLSQCWTIVKSCCKLYWICDISGVEW